MTRLNDATFNCRKCNLTLYVTTDLTLFQVEVEKIVYVEIETITEKIVEVEVEKEKIVYVPVKMWKNVHTEHFEKTVEVLVEVLVPYQVTVEEVIEVVVEKIVPEIQFITVEVEVEKEKLVEVEKLVYMQNDPVALLVTTTEGGTGERVVLQVEYETVIQTETVHERSWFVPWWCYWTVFLSLMFAIIVGAYKIDTRSNHKI